MFNWREFTLQRLNFRPTLYHGGLWSKCRGRILLPVIHFVDGLDDYCPQNGADRTGRACGSAWTASGVPAGVLINQHQHRLFVHTARTDTFEQILG